VPKHTLTLGRVPAKALVEAVSTLVEAARQASRLRGAPESELEVVSLAGGVVELDAPVVLGDETAIDVFADALSAALSEKRESVFADGPLLELFARFSRSSSAGLELARSNGEVLSLRPADVAVLEHLLHVTPGNRAVRVVGDLKPESTPGMATLVVPNCDSVRVRFTGLVPLSARTVVSGIGHFGPSGACFLVDAEYIGSAVPGDELFEEVPRSHPWDFIPPSIPQDALTGVKAFFGTWPGDETDEELLAALKAIRR
jgi:hypothetical protein